MLKTLFEGLYGLYAAVLFVLVFGTCGLLLAITPDLRLRRQVVRGSVRSGLWLAGLPFRVHGSERVPDEACVVVANHASYLDGPLLMAALPPRFTFVVHDGVVGWPVLGYLTRRAGVVFVSRSDTRKAAARTKGLLQRLQRGESLLIFPEGTFKPPVGLMRFKRGAFALAALARRPVVPLVLLGTRKLYGGGRRWLRWSPVEVTITPPLAVTEDAAQLRDRARERILALCGEPDLDTASP